MPRINIEDGFWIDPRYTGLAKKIGEDRALGQVIRFWKIAQSFYKQEGRPVPTVIFEAHRFSSLLFEFGFAERVEGGVSAVGSRGMFEWLLQRVRAGGSNKSNDISSVSEAERERNGNGTGTERAPLTLTLSLNTNTGTGNNTNTLPPTPESGGASSGQTSLLPEPSRPTSKKAKPVQHDQELCRKIWATYDAAYRSRYHGKAPIRNASVNSQIVQLSKRLGEDAIQVVAYYLTCEDNFYRQKYYALGPCLSDAEALHTRCMTGVKSPLAGLPQFKTAAEKKQENLRAMAAKYLKTPLVENQDGGPDGDK